MPISSGQTLSGEIDADSAPTATLVLNGDDNGATVTITAKSADRYSWSFTVPTVESGDLLQLAFLADGVSRVRWSELITSIGDTLAGEVDADSAPTVTAVVNGVDSAAIVTVSLKATGRYKWSLATPLVASGDNLQIVANVDGISSVIWSGIAGIESDLEAEAPAADEDFLCQLMADDFTFGFMETGFQETVTYTKRTGATRSIKAIVNRNPPENENGETRPKLTIEVANNATTGILSSELNAGGDTITLAYRKGATATTYRILRSTQPLTEDCAGIQLELH
jgi:hypothetical protein